MFPLLHLLSAFVRVGTIGEEQGSTSDLFMIDGAILPNEWQRFLIHAEFVQSLNDAGFYWSPESRSIAPSTWVYLGVLCGGTPLLPHVRRLSWTIESPQSTSILSLLSPSIESLTISSSSLRRSGLSDDSRREWQSCIRSTLHLISSNAIHISQLTLNSNMEPSSLCLSVWKLQSLRVFTVGKVDIADLHALSQLPNLAELYLTSIQGSIQDFSTQTAIEFSS
ncbi:hypothetical protein BD311DRAFT_107620 [Dichomitus squalens]|uniref:Uncharacterized protein n=1 Tax=Dichomitus squalens TaxID=114155 RepID=A0A4Q9M9E2_9APHY|nr:hypothetical protein BD311DRAFT_107620 [Dichomitus squalens]